MSLKMLNRNDLYSKIQLYGSRLRQGGVKLQMYRYAIEELKKWKKRKNRKPLIIRGARQVGKTWLIREFGKKEFAEIAYFNCENNARLAGIFDLDFDISRIIKALQIESGKKIAADRTLIVFDEIQEIPKTLSALKYFQENGSEYAVIAAGSLLGIALHQGTSFPVGKVDFLDLYPLNFREFLLASGEEGLAGLLGNDDMALMNSFGSKIQEYLKLYYYIGGMPEAVQTWINTHDTQEVRVIQKNLLDFYDNDFSKHAPATVTVRIRMVWNVILKQLAKENRKFVFGLVREGSRAKDFDLAIEWLRDYGLVYKINRINKPDIPLKAYIEIDQFKLFMLDTGLLAAMGDIDPGTILDGNKIFEEFKGALTEQFVLQQLISDSGILPYYFSAENSRGEIDFLIQNAGKIIPLEVKAEENLKARSLKAFCDKYHPEVALRTSMSPYRKQEWMVNVPLYDIAPYIANIK